MGLLGNHKKIRYSVVFFQAVNGLLRGRQDITTYLSNIHAQNTSLLNRTNLPSNITSNLMIYAFKHIMDYNVLLAKHCEKIFFMEDVISDPSTFYQNLELLNRDNFTLSLEQGISHKKIMQKYIEVISNYEEFYEKFASFKFKIHGDDLSVSDIELRLNQKNQIKSAQQV